ncbi:PP2C family protein-serine/threonine phosphatase [Corynebacterium cystitidis]|uniref:PP2C family protein-serine/threonine phosphatase n=1 Tax=Corynebacterium cystitidis TaxID=35757 RepID=UPI00211E27C1|nr:protein phosphatase 2C domain-containing protein [Corynebacterium cystitidis]
MSLKLNFVAVSDRGLVRGNNEDSAYAGPHLLLLADGMGGHAAGEVASQLMVRHMEHLDQDPEDNDMLALLGAAADDANASIADAIRENPEQDGMGTTLTALLFNGREFGLIHAGDSRGYRLRDGKLEQITIDDTFVQSLVEQGKLDPEDVSTHPQKSLILKAFTGRPVEPGLAHVDARAGDRLLLCSDGLSDPVTASTIEESLGQGTPDEAAHKLIELALRSGGPDNITIVIADIVDTHTDSATRMPTKPAVAGALALEQKETHPDTAAGRAAALNKNRQVIPPNQGGRNSDAGEANNDELKAADNRDDKEPHSRRGKGSWALIVSLLTVLIVVLAGGFFLDKKRDESFFVSTNEQGAFVVEHGFDYAVFGNALHEPIQHTCINDKNELKFVDIDAVPEDCQLFTVDDLPESIRGQAQDLSGGSFDEVSQQMNRLADEALPVCVEAPHQRQHDKAEADSKAEKPSESAVSSVECREVK